jgi:glutamate---cysteine ligase / carboxylate-amine ligase
MSVADVDVRPVPRLGSPSRPSGAPTVGVEEEFTLVDPSSGAVVPWAAEVIRDCADAALVVPEVMSCMVETRTPVCRNLTEVRSGLITGRARVMRSARRHAAVATASGVAPFGQPNAHLLTETPRYAEMARRFPFPMLTSGTCACHVHVGVPTRQLGVEALLRLRPWLPALIALTANSPIWMGRETRWASQRFALVSRWPTAVPAPPVSSVDEYDGLVRDAVRSGDALDARNVYFLARLSPRYPTIEVRVADVGLTTAETVCYAGLVRALVATAVDEAVRGVPATMVGQVPLRRACRSAARAGLGGTINDPLTGERVRCWQMVDALVAEVLPRLRANGDDEAVLSTLDWLRGVGGGADRQRRLFREADTPAVLLAALARAMSGGISG